MQRTFSKLPLAAVVALAAILTAVPLAAEAKPPPAGNLETFEADFDAALDAADAEFKVAHSGGMAKDKCHRDRKAGERHYHKAGSTERAGPCLKIDGRTWRFKANGLCARERAAFARDEKEGWGIDWKRHAMALLNCVLAMRAPPNR